MNKFFEFSQKIALTDVWKRHLGSDLRDISNQPSTNLQPKFRHRRELGNERYKKHASFRLTNILSENRGRIEQASSRSNSPMKPDVEHIGSVHRRPNRPIAKQTGDDASGL